MKKFSQLLLIGLFFSPMFMIGQNLRSVWHQIENNNLTIRALKQQSEAERMGNRVGLAPENPEVEFAYLWGTPSEVGHRIDVSVTQSFDFPTSYVYRGRIANLKNEQAEIAVRKECREMMIEIGKLYYEIVYQNVRISDANKCLSYVSNVSKAYKQKLDAGSINIFDYNKVKLTELNMRQELEHAIVRRDNLLRELQQYNGGQAIPVADTLFPPIALPPSFDSWYQQVEKNNPMLAWIDKEQEINVQQQKLDKSGWAPQFSAGYMREQVPSETFQGIKIGISVPLWHNVNSLKQTKLQSSAITLLAADEQFQFRNRLQSQYAIVDSHLKQVAEYESLLADINSFELLQLALEKGEISLVDYLMEYSIYHESHEKLFELERDAAQNFVEIELLTNGK